MSAKLVPAFADRGCRVVNSALLEAQIELTDFFQKRIVVQEKYVFQVKT
jgi:hypothetical protein